LSFTHAKGFWINVFEKSRVDINAQHIPSRLGFGKLSADSDIETEVANIKVETLPVVIHKIPDPAPVKILPGMNFIESVKMIVDGKNGTFDLEGPQF